VFREAYAAGGWTMISMAALMSSAYASMHGGCPIGLRAPARRTLAECLLENGYWTAGFTANPVCGHLWGFHRGFAFFRDLQKQKTPLPPGAPKDIQKECERFAEMGIPLRDTQITADAKDLTDKALRWLETRSGDEPFFLWLHYMDPHWPCQMTGKPPSPQDLQLAWRDYEVFHNQVVPSRGTFDPGHEMRGRWALRYRECVTAADHEVGRLLEVLRGRPDWGRTIVAATADHGEEFYERGTWHHSWNQLHKEGIHVPLLIRVPGHSPLLIGAPVGLLDLAPTLLDFAGIDIPLAMIGRTLRPLAEEPSTATRPVFTEMMGHVGSAAYRLAIRDGDWKYIFDFEQPHASKLFRIPDDPQEDVNLRDSCPDILRRFEEMRLVHTTRGLVSLMQRQSEGGRGGQNAHHASPMDSLLFNAGLSGENVMREQLEALGYI
jgi:arylsulfatase